MWRGTKTTPPAMSRNARTTLRQITRLEHRIALQRQTVTHRLTKQLATGHDLIAIEDLNTRGMTATPAAKPDPDQPGAFLPNGRATKRGLNRAILRAGFGEFRRQLTYKTRWYGSMLVVIDRWAATSKTCSTCSTVKPKLTLRDRVYECDECGLALDRDVNAARNILAHGRRATENGPDQQPASPRERGSRSVKQTPLTGANAARKGPPSAA